MTQWSQISVYRIFHVTIKYTSCYLYSTFHVTVHSKLILLYTVHFILLCTGHYSTFHITVYIVFATYLHFVPVFWTLYLSIIPICRKYERLNSSFTTIIITGLSETPLPLQLLKCNYRPRQCATSHHQNWLICVTLSMGTFSWQVWYWNHAQSNFLMAEIMRTYCHLGSDAV